MRPPSAARGASCKRALTSLASRIPPWAFWVQPISFSDTREVWQEECLSSNRAAIFVVQDMLWGELWSFGVPLATEDVPAAKACVLVVAIRNSALAQKRHFSADGVPLDCLRRVGPQVLLNYLRWHVGPKLLAAERPSTIDHIRYSSAICETRQLRCFCPRTRSPG